MSLREGDCAVPRTWQSLPCPLLCPGTRPGMGALACPGMLMRRAEAVGAVVGGLEAAAVVDVWRAAGAR
jgi:hypothetical protein